MIWGITATGKQKYECSCEYGWRGWNGKDLYLWGIEQQDGRHLEKLQSSCAMQAGQAKSDDGSVRI